MEIDVKCHFVADLAKIAFEEQTNILGIQARLANLLCKNKKLTGTIKECIIILSV